MTKGNRGFRVGLGASVFVWFLIGLFLITLRTVSDYWLEGALLDTEGYLEIFLHEMLMVLAWALVTPFVIKLCRRQVVGNQAVMMVAISHLALFGFFLGLRALFLLLFGIITGAEDLTPPLLFAATFDWIELNVIIYLLVASVGYAIQFHAKYIHQGTVQRRLERQLAAIEFDGLKMQAQPEFLIRSLGRVSDTLDASPDAAEELVTRLSSLLRNTLVHSNTEQVPLEEEISMFEDYLQMQKVANPAFSYSVEVELGAWAFKVPSMVLQPMVEAAMAGDATARFQVHLKVEVQSEWLRLVMQIGTPFAWVQGVWTFEANMERVRKRLRRLYEGRHVLNLVHTEREGIEITLLLPLETTHRETEYYAVY